MMDPVTTPLKISAAGLRMAGYVLENNLRVAQALSQVAMSANPFMQRIDVTKMSAVQPKRAPAPGPRVKAERKVSSVVVSKETVTKASAPVAKAVKPVRPVASAPETKPVASGAGAKAASVAEADRKATAEKAVVKAADAKTTPPKQEVNTKVMAPKPAVKAETKPRVAGSEKAEAKPKAEAPVKADAKPQVAAPTPGKAEPKAQAKLAPPKRRRQPSKPPVMPTK